MNPTVVMPAGLDDAGGRPDDPLYFDTVIEDLGWKGYEFREGG